MPLVKNKTCTECGKRYMWVIDRPGDGFWDRFRNDSGDTLGSWFSAHSLCYDHAMAVMPEKFKSLLHTRIYEEFEPETSV